MPKTLKVLFIVENDYYPEDMRVFNECSCLSRAYPCYVLAPRKDGQKLAEQIGSVTCFRFPHYEAKSLKLIFVEYFVAALWVALLVPLIALVKRINIVHVANPPDFVIPLVSWLKIFGVRFIFDIHDLSVETFMGKAASRSHVGSYIAGALGTLESWSIDMADAVIATNSSIKEHVINKNSRKAVYVVRNSNPVRFNCLEEVGKRSSDGMLNIGYFGVLANDEAAGLDHLFHMAEVLNRQSVSWMFSIVGDGPGLRYLRSVARQKHLEDRFRFFGYVNIPEAFALIKDFDFGLVTWGYLPKNHMHTAMKIMDYMCCAVPVCSLRLKEQLISTQGIGVHRDSFEEIAEELARLHRALDEYETLRRATLAHFNGRLAWELQERTLCNAYAALAGEQTTECQR